MQRFENREIPHFWEQTLKALNSHICTRWSNVCLILQHETYLVRTIFSVILYR